MSDVTIIYCRPCGYERRAKDIAAALCRQLALETDLVPGKGGIFQIKVGDRIVASRSKGHCPGADAIVAAVTAARH
jgi:selenoprotein W-related protein